MKLLASRTATLPLPLPRPHQVWQPTSFLALHTLPTASHTDIHYYLHLSSLLNHFNLSLPKFKNKTEIICTVTAKFKQYCKKILVCDMLFYYMIEFCHTVADELWKLFMLIYELRLIPWGRVIPEKPVGVH
jgi:hypothetical protein